jgi:hypothetical protein
MDDAVADAAAWLERVRQTEDPSFALDPAALGAAEKLAELLGKDETNIQIAWLLGHLRWFQYLALPEGEDRAAFDAAVDAFMLCFLVGVTPLPRPLLPVLADSAAATAGAWLNQAQAADASEFVTRVAELWQEIAAATPAGHLDRPGRLANLGIAHWRRYEMGSDPADLDACIAAIRLSLAEMRMDANEHGPVLSNLCTALASRYELTNDLADLDAVIAAGQELADTAKPGTEAKADSLSKLAFVHQRRFQRSRKLADLGHAIHVGRQAVKAAATPPGRATQAAYLGNLAADLRTRYEQAGKVTDLDEAVDLLERRYTRTEQLADLDQVEDTVRLAVAATPDDDLQYAERLAHLGTCLRVRFLRLDAEPDMAPADVLEALDAAIETDRQVSHGIGSGHAAYASRQSYLGISLYRRFELTGLQADLDESIEASRRAALSASDGQPDIADLWVNLGIALQARYRSQQAAADLDEAIGAFQHAVTAMPGADPETMAMRHGNLTEALRDRYQRTQRAGDLDAVIDAARTAVDVAAQALGIPEASGLIRLLVDSNRDQASAIVDAAMRARQSQLVLAARWSQLGQDLLTRSSKAAAWTDLDEAISCCRHAAQAASYSPSDQARYMGQLANALYLRFTRTGELSCLDEASEILRAALEIDSPEHVRHVLLRTVSMVSVSRFDQTRSQADLDEGIDAARQAMGLVSPGSSDYAVACSELASALKSRFTATGAMDELDEAVELTRQALEISAADELMRPTYSSRLCGLLKLRFDHTGRRADLDEAIGHGQQAIASGPADHVDRAAWLIAAGHALRTRYEHYGVLDDSVEAISMFRQAVEATSPASLNRANALSALSAGLRAQGRYADDPALLDEAVDAARGASETLSSAKDDPAVLTHLAAALSARFASTDVLADLDEAITALRQALSRGPAPDLDVQPIVFTNLAIALTKRAGYSGSLQDLDQAVDAARHALDLTSATDLRRSWRLDALANILGLRYHRTGAEADIREAIAAQRQAVEATEPGRLHQVQMLGDLGGELLRLAVEADGPADAELEEAISWLRQALDIEPEYVFALGNLSAALLERADRQGRPGDLDEAIVTARKAISLIQADDSRRAQYLRTLGMALYARHSPVDHPVDPGEVLGCFLAAFQTTSAPPDLRVSAARVAARVVSRIYPAYAADLLEQAVRLLPEIASHSLARADRQYALGGVASLAADAASLALVDGSTPGEQLRPIAGMPSIVTFSAANLMLRHQDVADPGQRAARAFSLLELGRAVMLTQAIDTRSDITELRNYRPAVADRYTQICEQLNSGDAPAVPEHYPNQHAAQAAAQRLSSRANDRRQHLVRQLAATVAEIRDLGGLFADFNRPPSAASLLRQARQGPVAAINVSRFGADALLLTEDGISRQTLPGVTLATLTQKVTEFEHALHLISQPGSDSTAAETGQETLSETLEWLWDTIAMPVMDALQIPGKPTPGSPLPRIWWIPTGPLTLLPLHAAGHHRMPAADRTRHTVMDRAISSYIPTVRALEHARQKAASKNPDTPQTLIVSISCAPDVDSRPLRNAESEALAVQQLTPHPMLMADTTSGDQHNEEPTAAGVLKQLAKATIAHFACHALSDPDDPSQSRLLVPGGPLTVSTFMPIDLSAARLAYLSACHTATSDATHLTDEVIHLATAFLTAGFPHVIGTLWKIDDQESQEIAIAFYREIDAKTRDLTGPSIAGALRNAIVGTRDKCPHAPSLWAAHTHTGA